jgi:hypothetical protein
VLSQWQVHLLHTAHDNEQTARSKERQRQLGTGKAPRWWGPFVAWTCPSVRPRPCSRPRASISRERRETKPDESRCSWARVGGSATTYPQAVGDVRRALLAHPCRGCAGVMALYSGVYVLHLMFAAVNVQPTTSKYWCHIALPWRPYPCTQVYPRGPRGAILIVTKRMAFATAVAAHPPGAR